MTPEGKVQTNILNYLHSLQSRGLPIYVEKRQAGGFAYKKGLPDIYFVYDGQHVELEVKRPGGTRSTLQEKWELRFKQIGIKYLCADSVEIVKDFVEKTFLSKSEQN